MFVALSCRRPAGRPVLLVFVEKMTSGAGHVTSVAGTCQTQLENIKENKFYDFRFLRHCSHTYESRMMPHVTFQQNY